MYWEVNPLPKIKKPATFYNNTKDNNAPTISRGLKGFKDTLSFLIDACDFWEYKNIRQNAKHDFWGLEEFILYNF